VIVVVNQNSTNSVQLGNDYCELRGVPPQNVLRITNWTGANVSWSLTDFDGLLRDPLLGMISSRGLTNQAEFVLLSMDIPYRVSDATGDNSTTSALFYGFKTNTPPPTGLPDSCSLPDNSSNSYSFAELPLRQGPPNSAPTNSLLAVMLTDSSLAGARQILARGVASGSTFPTQTVYLEKTSDQARNVRFIAFDNAIFDTRIRGDNSLVRIDSDSTSFTDTFGLLTGFMLYAFPTNAFIGGALADTLTSYAGDLFENSGQTPLLVFLEAGASGSYGTVVEPCNYTEKFPDPLDYFYQARGFSLAEAYYMSLRNPYQGVMVGEPLSAPFAHTGGATWNSLTNGSTLSGQVTLTPVFSAAATNLPIGQIDLFVDGRFYRTMTNLPPTMGNSVTVTLNNFPTVYSVPPNATVASVVTGLASALNANSNSTSVIAFPTGDRIELDSTSVAALGSIVTGSVHTTGSPLTTWATLARPGFLDSAAKGYLGVQAQNAPAVGDWLRLDFVKTNGSQVTVAITNAVAGTQLGSLVQSLVNLVNGTSSLQSPDGVLADDLYVDNTVPVAQFFIYARTAGWPAAQIQATFTSSANLGVQPNGANLLQDNVSDLRPRNHLYISSGLSSVPVQFPLDTTQLADGFHELAAVAYEGTSVQAQTRTTRLVQVHNTTLTATCTPMVNVTNVTMDTPLEFVVSANTTAARIDLFSTAGLVATAANQSTTILLAPSAMLGQGLHPFYAVVTDNTGRQFQTQTVWIRLVPSFALTLAAAPPEVSWPAIIGQRYEILTATNLNSSYRVLGSLTATSTVAQWPLPAPAPGSTFYRVRLSP
jgi:uncharacterized protein (TIGR03790 family)